MFIQVLDHFFPNGFHFGEKVNIMICIMKNLMEILQLHLQFGIKYLKQKFKIMINETIDFNC